MPFLPLLGATALPGDMPGDDLQLSALLALLLASTALDLAIIVAPGVRSICAAASSTPGEGRVSDLGSGFRDVGVIMVGFRV